MNLNGISNSQVQRILAQEVGAAVARNLRPDYAPVEDFKCPTCGNIHRRYYGRQFPPLPSEWVDALEKRWREWEANLRKAAKRKGAAEYRRGFLLQANILREVRMELRSASTCTAGEQGSEVVTSANECGDTKEQKI